MSDKAIRRRITRDPALAVAVSVRLGVLALCALLVLTDTSGSLTPELAALAAVAAAVSLPLPASRVTALLPLFEAAAAALIMTASAMLPEPLLPYLLVPPLAAGLQSGVVFVIATSTVELVGLVLGRAIGGEVGGRAQVISVAQWVGLGLATGLVGAWARSAQRRARLESDTYAAAHGLLTRLRDIARQLPAGLDEVNLAEQVLGSLNNAIGFDRGALFVRGESGPFTTVAFKGTERVDLTPSTNEGLWGLVWQSGRALQRPGMFSDLSHGQRAVLPMRLGDRRIGLIAIEGDSDRPWPARDLLRAAAMADDAALRIDTAQLFSDVRALATVEERRRLAREIHDGIAQDIASLGYVVDDLAATSNDPHARQALDHVRGELTRLVTELRLSIFDLRSDVQTSTGLGSALSSYVRQVGSDSGLTVHLVLEEAAERLPIEIESELLRIAQEAVTNARKHAQASNLWVTCRVEPPKGFLRVADDGTGLGEPRPDSFGMEIMRERAARLGASLSVRNRVGGGTVVEVGLGGATVASDGAGSGRG
ncbi:MAG: hypothetical protein EPO13_00750 [Actinomycetota bacterium]|nr:MAG: hypothetical protein EPO13_00750 [Actinomycetota bacterium]